MGLSAGGQALFRLVLDHACWWLVTLVRELPEFSPTTAIEVLHRTSDMMATLEDIRSRLPLTTLDAPHGWTYDDEFRQRYNSYLINVKGFVDLIGVSTHNYRHRLPIEAAYLSLRASPGEHEHDQDSSVPEGSNARWYVPSSGGAPWSDFNSLRIEPALARSSRILLRGEAGSGKTTLMDWLTVMTARGALPTELASWNGLVPFPIRLRSFVGEPLPRPEQFLAHCASWLAGLEPAAWTIRQLNQGRCLLLVDGLDELPVTQRNGVKRWLKDLVATWPAAKIVVTSRPHAAATRWLEDLGFASIVLERMRESDVRRFIRHWHVSAARSDSLPCDPALLPQYEKQLLAGLEARLDLQSVATNPLLCAMLCAVNADRGGLLPNDRMAVYTSALEMLLERRDAERDIAHPTTARTSQVLIQDLAWYVTLNNRSEMAKSDAVRLIARRVAAMPNVDQPADDLLQYLIDRSGVIREPAIGKLDFVHRSFQEFLAAAEAVEENHVGALVERAHLDNWRETIIMTCGHANRPQRTELLTNILARADAEPRNRRRLRLLVGSCLGHLTDLDPSLVQRIADSVTNYVPPRTTSEARILSTLGPWILNHFPADIRALPSGIASSTVRAAGLTGSSAALPVLARYAHRGQCPLD